MASDTLETGSVWQGKANKELVMRYFDARRAGRGN